MYIAVDRSSPTVPGLDVSALPPTAVGCIGLRHLEADIGEVKRMFVQPHYRGQKVAERLMHAVIKQAITLRYSKLRLDTLARLQSANRLYGRMGFYSIPPYNDCPIEGAMWFELDLSAHINKAAVSDDTTLH